MADQQPNERSIFLEAIEIASVEERCEFLAKACGDDAGLRAELNELFEERGVLVFDGVDPTPRMQVAVSNVFGPLKDHPSKAT